MAWWLFQNLIVTALLAGVVALACRATRIGPVIRHGLWLIVLIKFITPPVLVWPWSAPDPLGIATLDTRQPGREIALAVPTKTQDVAVGLPPPLTLASLPATADRWPRTDPVVGDSPVPLPADIATLAWPWLIAAWIVGSVCVLILEATRLLRLAHHIRRARPGPQEIVARVDRLAKDLGLRAVDVIAVNGQSSPAIWCVGRPKLLWPASLSAEPACLDGLLVHELAHVQRRDHLVGWIDLVAGVIWWWNPLFWYVRSALREQAELACDAWVISALPNGRRAYAESLLLLSSAAVQGRSPALAAVIGIRANNRRVLERRLVMIMQGRAPLRLSIAGLVALAVIAMASLPAWATGQQPTTPVPVSPTVVVQQPTPSTVKPTTAPAPFQTLSPITVKSGTVTAITMPAQAMTPVSVKPLTTVAPVMPGQTPVTVVQQGTGKPVTVQTVPAIVPGQPSPFWGAMPQIDPQGKGKSLVYLRGDSDLPADGQELAKKFEADRDAIQQEADKKIEARRAEFIKTMQALQDQYTKAGKLDEAVAIRDYIKMVSSGNFVWIKHR